MTKIIPFKKHHIDCMDLREHEKFIFAMPDFIENIEHTSVACTGIIDGRIICCGGVIPHKTGNSDIWLLPSAYVSSVKLTFVKELRKWLFGVRENLQLNRMQTYCLNDDLHTRWMTFLGFEKEGVMRKYFQGQDYAIWGRTWE